VDCLQREGSRDYFASVENGDHSDPEEIHRIHDQGYKEAETVLKQERGA
jgi:hypothetical protein